MAQSFIVQGACTICTEMTGGEPMKIGLSRSTLKVIHTKESAPLLNIDDRKLNDQFECKIAAKFWGGLQVLTAVLAIGALAIATVATGGVALVVAGIAVAAVAVSIGSGVAALYKMAHDCDCTLESQWMLFHDKVNIEGKSALLKISLLKCNKGGMISIILDEKIAIDAAKTISDNNTSEVYAHMLSQALQGVITVATGFNPASIIVAAPLSIYFYCDGESDKEELRAQNTEAIILERESTEKGFGEELGGALQNEGISAGANLPGEFITNTAEITAINRQIMTEAREMGVLAMERELAGDTAGAASARLGQDIAERSTLGFKDLGLKTLGGLLKGLAWGLVNFGIDYGIDQYEDKKFRESLDEFLQARKSDSGTLSVIAQTK